MGLSTTGLEKRYDKFEVVSDYTPSGDQPQAIKELAQRINNGEKDVVLLGATGTGKSATTAWLVEQVQRPTLVLEPNKTLAAQITQEFRDLFPNNAVEYFVSYYDYYQPEAYIPQSDTFIEKDSSINDEVERLRHSATASLLTRRDTIVVASVSCIYGLGAPEEYLSQLVKLEVGEEISRDDLLRNFISMQYQRNDMSFERGTFRVKGDTVEIIPVYEELAIRIEFFGDEVDAISILHPLTGDKIQDVNHIEIFPASHYVAGEERTKKAIETIEEEMKERVEWFKKRGKLVEAQRLEMRTTFDLEMIKEIGTCKGIENYSRHFDGRAPGSAPNTLLDFFDDDFLLVIDESHVTVPQIGAMFEGDASRKRMLIDYGFRLPSAADNRPLKWPEFQERIGQTVYLSATPGNYEMDLQYGGDGSGEELEKVKDGGKPLSGEKPVELIIRPTGLVDPEIEVRQTKGQIDDLLEEIRKRTNYDESSTDSDFQKSRILVTTLTKKMAEDLTVYLREKGVKVEYLHSDVDTLRRVELLTELRQGKFDVLVGINLLREGLDLPEVSLVSIIDADKQGFLRSYRSLIQTIGRAARNVNGKVIMYADSVTPQMKEAIDETNRRRNKQIAYNKEHNIDPKPLQKKIADVTDQIAREDADTQQLLESFVKNKANKTKGEKKKATQKAAAALAGVEYQARQAKGEVGTEGLDAGELTSLVEELSGQMREAASQLNFELAARLRDEIADIKKTLRGLSRALS
ncbi:MAG: excinuclease ABC subunit UvrB [Candidatus Ancillula sp.]|jgi:excinuclease ABC subunit B|nr:excinuclease ABC subunit UvrB [Candidatus Ancillula sp.]